jgi:hypothetical protein
MRPAMPLLQHSFSLFVDKAHLMMHAAPCMSMMFCERLLYLFMVHRDMPSLHDNMFCEPLPLCGL